MSKPKYSLFIGRWQGVFHGGHKWLIDNQLKLGKNVLIAIRDVEPDEKNPWTAEQVEENIHKELAELIAEGRVKTMIIPDITDVNYGRGVGYGIIEHVPPPEIHEISATKIRMHNSAAGAAQQNQGIEYCNCESEPLMKAKELSPFKESVAVCSVCEKPRLYKKNAAGGDQSGGK